MAEVKTLNTEVEYTDLTGADIQYIEDMANFYEISREDALERFLTGNIEGNVLTEDEISELEEYVV